MTPSAERLVAIERWWGLTKNPLYAWEAIRCCLKINPPLPLPVWCTEYLEATATNIIDLAMRYTKESEDAWGETQKAIPEALGMVKPRTKNAFARAYEDSVAMGAALQIDRDAPEGAVIETITVGPEPGQYRAVVRKQPSVADRLGQAVKGGEERAQRKLARGRKLLGQ